MKALKFTFTKPLRPLAVLMTGPTGLGLLVAVAFVVASALTRTPLPPPTAPALSTIPTGPVLAASSLSPQIIITNFQWQAPTLHVVLPAQHVVTHDPWRGIYPSQQISLDLIDFRYQPDLKLEDMK